MSDSKNKTVEIIELSNSITNAILKLVRDGNVDDDTVIEAIFLMFAKVTQHIDVTKVFAGILAARKDVEKINDATETSKQVAAEIEKIGRGTA